jgi:hypothetical protein
MQMEAHGQFKLGAYDNILYARLNGSWNEETAFLFSKKFKALIEKSMPQRWAHIVFMDDWELGVPEIEPIVKELVDWCIARGLVCAAQVFSRSMIVKYQIDKMVTENSGVFSRKQFTDEHAAISWLRDKGFEIKPDRLQNNFQ